MSITEELLVLIPLVLNHLCTTLLLRLAQGYCGSVNSAMDRHEARLQKDKVAALAAAAGRNGGGGGAQRVPVAASPPAKEGPFEAAEVEEAGMKAVVESFDAHVEELTAELKRMCEGGGLLSGSWKKLIRV
jgi:hypothetical protein